MEPLKVHLIAGARPNFMKVAPLWRRLETEDWCRPILVHTGQHYDAAMSDSFLTELGLPTPHHALEVGSGSHAQQTAKVMLAYDEALNCDPCDLVVVVGDVNSTVAAALVAAKRGTPVAHLEAGLRSRDRTMPEEINRIVTDTVSDILWTPSPDADENLRAEGIPGQRIARVGNIMIDAFELMRERIEQDTILSRFGLTDFDYGVVTLHRPSNVDDALSLSAIVQALIEAQSNVQLVFPEHPRTRQALIRSGLRDRLADSGIMLTDPLGYTAFMKLVTASRLVITDSGGVQEETTYLGIPCLTLRPNTERPITITLGTNRLVTAESLGTEISAALSAPRNEAKIDLWDGRTADRVAEHLRNWRRNACGD